VPQAGDNLVFTNTSLGADTTLANNITSLSVGTITFQGTGSHNFTLTGNAITVAGGISTTSFPTIDLNLTLGANQAITGLGLFFGDTSTTPVLALGGRTLTIGTGSDLPTVYMYGTLSGSGTVAVQTSASVSLLGNNSAWSGNVTVANSGVVQAYVAGSLGNASNTVTVASGGNVSFCGLNGATIAQNITVGGTDALNAAQSCGGGGGSASQANVTLSGTVTLSANTTVYAAGAMTVTGPLSGGFTIALASGQPGSLVINSSNNTSNTPNGTSTASVQTVNYTGSNPSTTINVPFNTTAVVDGTYGNTTVQSGGILEGSGTVGVLTIGSGGTVAPGHSPGCLNSGNFTLNGAYQAEIGGTTACTGYDQINVTGAVDVSNGTLNVSLYNGFKPAEGQTYTIINNDATDAVTGPFTGMAEGSTFTVSGYVFKISYVGGDGNDVVLTVLTAPATPDTGFAFASSHPGFTLGVSALAAGTIFGLARRNTRKLAPARAKATRRR
jgi:hypothetical protein